MQFDTVFGLSFKNGISFFSGFDPGFHDGVGLLEETSLGTDYLFKVVVIKVVVELIKMILPGHADLIVCSRYLDGMVTGSFLSVPPEGARVPRPKRCSQHTDASTGTTLVEGLLR